MFAFIAKSALSFFILVILPWLCNCINGKVWLQGTCSGCRRGCSAANVHCLNARFKTASVSPKTIIMLYSILVQITVKKIPLHSQTCVQNIMEGLLISFGLLAEVEALSNTFWALNSCVSVNLLWSHLESSVAVHHAQHPGVGTSVTGWHVPAGF